MSTHAPNGIDVTYLDGTVEHVDCTEWWTAAASVLHTDGVKEFTGPLSYRLVRGPSFPLASIRKWEETR